MSGSLNCNKEKPAFTEKHVTNNKRALARHMKSTIDCKPRILVCPPNFFFGSLTCRGGHWRGQGGLRSWGKKAEQFSSLRVTTPNPPSRRRCLIVWYQPRLVAWEPLVGCCNPLLRSSTRIIRQDYSYWWAAAGVRGWRRVCASPGVQPPSRALSGYTGVRPGVGSCRRLLVVEEV